VMEHSHNIMMAIIGAGFLQQANWWQLGDVITTVATEITLNNNVWRFLVPNAFKLDRITY
jgi:hypothetical protein